MGVIEMRADYIWRDELSHVYAALMPPNRQVLRVAEATGLRIGDVLALTRAQVARGRVTVVERKTGKSRRVTIPADVRAEVLATPERGPWAWPGRTDQSKHRTRQAVYRDLRRAARAFRLPEHVSPHSLRKVYAVKLLERTGDMGAVQRELRHESAAVTYIYAMADVLTERRLSRRGGRASGAGGAHE